MSSIDIAAQQVADNREYCLFVKDPSQGTLAAFRVNSRRDRILLSMDGPNDVMAYQRNPETGDYEMRPFNRKGSLALDEWIDGLHQELVNRVKAAVARELPLLKEKHGVERVVFQEQDKKISIPKKRSNGSWIRYIIHVSQPEGLASTYTLCYLDPILQKPKFRLLGCPPQLIDGEIDFVNYEAFKAFIGKHYPEEIRAAQEGVILEDFRDKLNDSYVPSRIFFEYHDWSSSIHLVYRDPKTGQIKRDRLVGREPIAIRSQIESLREKLDHDYNSSRQRSEQYFKKRLLPQGLLDKHCERLRKGKKSYYLSYDEAQKQFVAHFYNPYLDTLCHEGIGGVGKQAIKAFGRKVRRIRRSFNEAKKLDQDIEILAPPFKPQQLATLETRTLILDPNYEGYTLIVPRKQGHNFIYHSPDTLTATAAQALLQELTQFSVSMDSLAEQAAPIEKEGVIELDDFGGFLELFDQIEFSSEKGLAHTVDPRSLSNDGLPTCPAQLREGLAALVTRLEGQHHFLGVNGNDANKATFFLKMRHLASEVLLKLQDCPSTEKQQRCLLELAEASLHCGGRCMAELYDWKHGLDDSWSHQPFSELKQTFLHALDKYKKALVQDLVAKGGNPENSHEYLSYLQTLQENNITITDASDVNFEDVFSDLGFQASFSSPEDMIGTFLQYCNPSSLLDFFETFFNKQLVEHPETYAQILAQLEAQIELHAFSSQEQEQVELWKSKIDARDQNAWEEVEKKVRALRAKYLPSCFSFENEEDAVQITRYGTLLLLQSFKLLSAENLG